ncbi:hypothetical protein CAOG_001276 [Capsaspora owczarzaki ATCC 30864]|uniref:Uncharacterized protein n=1 Tax=Capsaspora owczarzaki (strain ATCC 30864) TaxID=595528 RepID=A0A0D2VIP3_CAPO3|nr:hypothetical protein CAOG_001276 [Capsaspora owczarzaki ATCC 30864]
MVRIESFETDTHSAPFTVILTLAANAVSATKRGASPDSTISMPPDTSVASGASIAGDAAAASNLSNSIALELDVYVSDIPREVARLLVTKHSVPVYLESTLTEVLSALIRREIVDRLAERDELAIRSLSDVALAARPTTTTPETIHAGTNDMDAPAPDSAAARAAARWGHAFKTEHVVLMEQSSPSIDIDFAEAYHRLMHSSACLKLLQLEQTYSRAVTELVGARQSDSLSRMLEKVGSEYTERDVNVLAARHVEEMQAIEAKWAKDIRELKTTQRRHYREFVLGFQETEPSTPVSPHSVLHSVSSPALVDLKSKRDNFSGFQQMFPFTPVKLKSLFGSKRWQTLANDVFESAGASTFSTAPEPSANSSGIAMEESFTIKLGSQVKTMHNLRLIAGDILTMSAIHAGQTDPTLLQQSASANRVDAGNAFDTQPVRVQTAMTLYSRNLSGLVLIVDKVPRFDSGFQKGKHAWYFAHLCEQSTDFHFQDFAEQIDELRLDLSTMGKQSFASTDFFITRHSNLASFHVVFHLVGERERASSLTSRSPILLGLRNVLAAATSFDVTTVTVPLLLTCVLTSEMNDRWCLKRAELVLKCVKGFMMETSSFGEGTSHTVQFFVPDGVSQSLFGSLSNLINTVFKLSAPLIAQ